MTVRCRDTVDGEESEKTDEREGDQGRGEGDHERGEGEHGEGECSPKERLKGVDIGSSDDKSSLVAQ